MLTSFNLWFSYQSKPQVKFADGEPLILYADKNHHYHVDGTVNQVAVKFIIDTGASMVAIPSNIAEKAGLIKAYPVTVNTANGRVEGHLTRIKALTISNITLYNVKAVILPKQLSAYTLLGMSALKRIDFEQKNKTLILKQRET
jgi:aspartyl protease family protein